MSVLSFFISNLLLVKTSDELDNLEQGINSLSSQYEMTLGTQELQKGQLDQLSSTLQELKVERDKLQAENLRIGELNETLDASLFGLEDLLGLPPSKDMTSNRADALTVMTNQRLFFLSVLPNGEPIDGLRINDSYGMRMHPILKKRIKHNGIDFKANIGTPVYATADGAVEYAGTHKSSGFGKLIILQHALGFKTYYAHLSDVKIKSGTFVSKGQLIGLSGNTGRSTGPHLHYEVRHLFRPIDPKPFMAWNISNFDSLFSEVKGIKWASLRKMYPLNQVLQTAQQ
ncbi:peptidoglycan DD-metalloendopeptidase family protein [Amphritea sp. 1_MG-2023]|uniref:M23 family metallopeptidase n=1 Tax=Amphritea sp. 1_MG-2023 TaxID=3062670 RepID=UPI0026E202D9|nr:peptidoglycan DD-metalloendopeptidase family protein [Amphritea sp. 1_MG-2023]MDO6563834.1 peptidoglycan DD-metalloendopeptidase family protein [Amphritea sp. 1_MG-2023]